MKHPVQIEFEDINLILGCVSDGAVKFGEGVSAALERIYDQMSLVDANDVLTPTSGPKEKP